MDDREKIHGGKDAPRYWTTLAQTQVPQAVRDMEYAARGAASALGAAFEGFEFDTGNGTYRILSDGTVQRTRIIGDCVLPVTEAWTKGFSDEPHDGAACVPPGGVGG